MSGTQGGSGVSGGSGGNDGGGSGGKKAPPPPRPAEFPLYAIILIVLAAVILIIVFIILIIYIRRRKRRQKGDVEKDSSKKPKKEKHGAKGHSHGRSNEKSKNTKPNEKSKIVNPASKGDGQKKTIKEERVVETQTQRPPSPDKRMGREKSLPAVPQTKKSVRPAHPTPLGGDYMDMTQQSTKEAKPLPTYDNKPSIQTKPMPTYDNKQSNQNGYEDEPENYEGLRGEYLQPSGGDTYQGLEGPERGDYVNEETGSYLELQPPGYEDPVPSAQLTAHYEQLK